MGLELSPIRVQDAGKIERGVTAFGRTPNGALIVTATGVSTCKSWAKSLARLCQIDRPRPAILPTLRKAPTGPEAEQPVAELIQISAERALRVLLGVMADHGRAPLNA
jgi:hypothetical protein